MKKKVKIVETPKYATGGGYHQWELPSSPSTPGYMAGDRGDMYKVPGSQGWMFKDPRVNDRSWEGYGNPANLLTNQPMQQRPMAAPITPVRGVAKQNPDTYYTEGTGSESDYSIDRVREQSMQMGGTMKKKVTIVEVPKMRSGGWASQVHGGLYLPDKEYDITPEQAATLKSKGYEFQIVG